MKQLHTLLFLFFLASFASVNAQNGAVDPVKWTHDIQSISSDENSEEFEIRFTAELEEGWHIYATELESDEGPIPTSFHFEENEAITLRKLKEPESIKQYDPNFMMELSFFEKQAVFYQDVVITASTTVKGYIEYMACDDKMCLPPEMYEFEIQLDKEDEEVLDPVRWNFTANDLGDDVYEIVFEAAIADNWHLYSSTIGYEKGPLPTEVLFDEEESHYVLIDSLYEDEAIEKFDPVFETELAFFDHQAKFYQKVKLKDANNPVVSGDVSFMACDDERCIFPDPTPFKINLKTGELVKKEIDVSQLQEGSLKRPTLDKKNPYSDCGIEAEEEDSSFWGIFILGFIGGLIALLTPCVFPMIPLTVSFFTKGSDDRKKGIAKATTYGFFIFAIYLILSIPFHLMDNINPEILNEISTNVYLNVFFFAIFVIFAISFFGYFEITLPSSWTNKADSASNIGGLIGIFFMALTLALVSFSCTGPILGSLLAGSLSADGGAMQLTVGMGGFGLALALPFALFAAFPGMLSSLPQSGGWLNTVKVVLGFVELGLAVKFLSNADLVMHWGILKIEAFLILWILIGIGLALYMFGVIKFPHDSPLKKLSFSRISFGVLVVAFVIYLFSGFRVNEKTDTYRSLTLLSGLAPPAGYSWTKPSKCPLSLECYKDYEEGLAVAQRKNKPILLDFTGWACVNCRKMEENVWVQPEILKMLEEDFILISLYVDDRDELPEDEKIEAYLTSRGNIKTIETIGRKWHTFQTENFEINTQPYYVVISPDEKVMNTPVGYVDRKEYENFLRCGLDAFKSYSKSK